MGWIFFSFLYWTKKKTLTISDKCLNLKKELKKMKNLWLHCLTYQLVTFSKVYNFPSIIHLLFSIIIVFNCHWLSNKISSPKELL